MFARDTIRVLRRILIPAPGTFPRRESGLDVLITGMQDFNRVVRAASVTANKLGRGSKRDQRYKVSGKILSYVVVAVRHVTLTGRTMEKAGPFLFFDRLIAEYENAPHMSLSFFLQG